MAVTIIGQLRISPQRVRITYSSDLGGTPTFYLWADGLLLAVTTETSYDFTVGTGETIQIDIFDSDSDSPAPVFPGKAVLQWEATPGAASYRVEEYVDAAWTLRTITIYGGIDVMSYATRYLEDDTVHQFRITPISAAGVLGTPVLVNMHMVRYPDEPSTAISMLASGKIRIASA